MRLGAAFRTALMLFTYFARRVVSRGALRSKVVRVAAAFGVVIFLIVATVICYFFLRPYADDERVWRLVFDVSTSASIMWALASYLFVKVLLLNAEGMQLLTLHLPITSRERSVAFLVYEAAMVMVVSVFGFGAMAGAAVLLAGPSVIPQLAASVVIPVAATYLVISILYEGIDRLLIWARFRRIKNPLLVLVVFAVIVAYSMQLSRLAASASAAYWADTTSQSIFNWAARLLQSGGVLALGIGASVVLGLLAGAAVAIAPTTHVVQSRFVPFPLGRAMRLGMGPYLAFATRSTQTWLSATLSVVLFVFLLLKGSLNPLWALAILSMIGLYQYANTVTVQHFQPRATPARIYLALLASQLVVMVPFLAVGVAAVAVVGISSVSGTLVAIAGCLSAIVAASFVGIAFPAQNDNPASTLIGLLVVTAVAGLAALAVGVLELPTVALAAALILVSGLFVWYGVRGIAADITRRRYEEVTIRG